MRLRRALPRRARALANRPAAARRNLGGAGVPFAGRSCARRRGEPRFAQAAPAGIAALAAASTTSSSVFGRSVRGRDRWPSAASALLRLRVWLVADRRPSGFVRGGDLCRARRERQARGERDVAILDDRCARRARRSPARREAQTAAPAARRRQAAAATATSASASARIGGDGGKARASRVEIGGAESQPARCRARRSR